MEPLTWAFIGTIIGTMVGAGASIFTTIFAASNAQKLQQNAASIERSELRREFQRSNLLELQETLYAHMRLTGRAHLSDFESAKNNSDQNGASLLPEDLNQELLVSNRKLSVLSERIEDDSLRKSIKSFRNSVTTALFKTSVNESLDALHASTIEFEKLMEQLGKVLRDNY